MNPKIIFLKSITIYLTVIFFLSVSCYAELYCEVTESCADYEVFAINQLSSAHGALSGDPDYNQKVCCSVTGPRSVPLNISDCSQAIPLRLLDTTNSHAALNTHTAYPHQICLAAVGAEITCDYSSNCSGYQTCMVRLTTGTSNLHLGDCNSLHPQNVCCNLTFAVNKGNCEECGDDIECISGNCKKMPNGTKVCIESGYGCANSSCGGVSVGFKECSNNLIYECISEDTWTSSSNGDSGQFDCQCVLNDYLAECIDGSTGCWDSFSAKCCGDDDNNDDYFYTIGHGGCVNQFSIGTADKSCPSIISVSSLASDYHSYVPASAKTGAVYFNSDLAHGKMMSFNINWDDDNADLGFDYLDGIKAGGLVGTIISAAGVPPKTLNYTFTSSDNSGSLTIDVQDAVHLHDQTIIIFTEDTTPPTGSILINNNDTYTTSPDVLLSLTYSDDIGIRDCSYSNDGELWTSWGACASHYPVDPSRAGYWQFEGNADDSSGHENHGTIYGASLTDDGWFDQAYEFDGEGDYIDCGNDESMDVIGNISIAAWIKFSADQAENLSNIFTNGDALRSLRLTGPGHWNGTNKALFHLNPGGLDKQLYSTSSLTPDTWYHILGVYDGSEMRLYINGILNNSLSATGSIASTTVANVIGAESATDFFFNGTIDEVALYGRSFSGDEVWDLYSSKAWRLLNADGTRPVYFKVRDFAGNTHTSSDSIILDTTKPGIIINNDNIYTNTTAVNLSLDFDFPGDPLFCSFRNDSMTWTDWAACPDMPDTLHPVRNWTLDDTAGQRMVSVRVNTSLGVIKENNDTIIYDPLPPDGSIHIYSIGIPGFHESNENYTAYTTVSLKLEFLDNEEVGGCRFANEENHEDNFTAFKECSSVETWILDDKEGLKTVYYQIIDLAGNIIEYNDSIYLNKTGSGLDVTPPTAPTIIDDGDWTNNNTMLHASWYGSYDKESEILTIPLVYNYSIGTSQGVADVVSWTYAGTATEVNHTGLKLFEDQIYYINVRVINSAGLTNESSSDGIRVDTIPPDISSILSSHDEAVWNYKSQNNVVSFNWVGQDSTSGVAAYSYILDQNSHTVPDTIPEGQIGTLYDETSVSYTNVIDGILYFHVRCLDNASNWGDTEHYEIWVDASPPITPQMSQPNVTANASQLTYVWTASYDHESGPVDYYFELSNSSADYNPVNLTNWTWTNATNITVYGLVPDLTYYARVLARNQANGTSQWSSEVSTIFDQNGPDINIIIPGNLGICNLKSANPVIRVETDESATCTFMDINDSTFTNFDYTNSIYHESQAGAMAEGNHTLNVKCYDIIGNSAEKNRTFNITPDSNILIENITLKDVYYTNRPAEIDIILAEKLGAVEVSYFNVELDGENLTADEFALTDNGCGRYALAFDAPTKAENYSLIITAGNDSELIFIDIINLNLTLTYTYAVPFNQSTELDKMTYADAGNTSIGIATDSYMSSISAAPDNVIELVSNAFDGSSYLFASNKGANIRARDKMLEENTFDKALNPSFGTVLEKDIYRTALSISYKDATLSGMEYLSAGRYQLLVKKVGVDSESGKHIIRITISE
ncbi:MAG: LamG-like jellyroll fold domain-containing protein [Nanoarchaeota archaeon]|nr:LamG-like jellyroll fold domain-containing protein [Nanoarchaeota archaeon]